MSRTQPRLHRWTRAEYCQMDEAGMFRDKHVELLGGRIIDMSPINVPHVAAVALAEAAARSAFGPGYWVRTQVPLDLGKYAQPHPDVAVVRGSIRDYAQHPNSALLVIEVSDTTLKYDRGPKARHYARAGIADYWIINLDDRQLEVHRNPARDPVRPKQFCYKDVMIVPRAGLAAPLAAPGATIAVADLLP